MGTWTIEYFRTAAGNIPFAATIQELSDMTALELGVAAESLMAEGMRLGEPRVKQVKGYAPLRELRVSAEGQQWRLIFFNPVGRRLVALEFCNRKDLDKALPLAKKRMREWNARRTAK